MDLTFEKLNEFEGTMEEVSDKIVSLIFDSFQDGISLYQLGLVIENVKERVNTIALTRAIIFDFDEGKGKEAT